MGYAADTGKRGGLIRTRGTPIRGPLWTGGILSDGGGPEQRSVDGESPILCCLAMGGPYGMMEEGLIVRQNQTRFAALHGEALSGV